MGILLKASGERFTTNITKYSICDAPVDWFEELEHTIEWLFELDMQHYLDNCFDVILENFCHWIVWNIFHNEDVFVTVEVCFARLNFWSIIIYMLPELF